MQVIDPVTVSGFFASLGHELPLLQTIPFEQVESELKLVENLFEGPCEAQKLKAVRLSHWQKMLVALWAIDFDVRRLLKNWWYAASRIRFWRSYYSALVVAGWSEAGQYLFDTALHVLALGGSLVNREQRCHHGCSPS